MKPSFILFSFAFVAIPIFLFAQGFDSGSFYDTKNQYTIDDTQSALDIEMVPEHPKAGENVKIRLFGYANDLDRSKISYFVNDQKKVEGIGVKTFSFTVGSIGETTDVKISIVLPTGFAYEKHIVIRPVEISIAWEAETYTPPFFEGKAMYSDQAKIKIIAYANGLSADGSQILPSSTVYTWKKDNRTIENASGIGKNTLTIDSDPSLLGNMNISVNIESFDGSINTKKTINIPSADPYIAYYLSSPATGLQMKVLKGPFKLETETASLVAIPYNLSTTSFKDGLLNYVWYMNSSKTSNVLPFLNIRKPEKKGYAKIETQAIINGKLFQRAEGELRVTFDE